MEDVSKKPEDPELQHTPHHPVPDPPVEHEKDTDPENIKRPNKPGNT